jgi:cellulose synthase/poly-beta-1,6-N-acetylglucosamine synthase-like glycosyltransferase
MQFVLALHVCASVVLAVYTVHQMALLLLYWRARLRPVSAASAETAGDLPPVLIQLPMYNERLLAQRVIEAVAAFEYPADRLRIQVLDDSTDDTRDSALAAVCAALRRGVDIAYVHRTERRGFKAGALAHGLSVAQARPGELVAVFDADFVPAPDFLQRVLVGRAAFADSQVGFVQTRWDYLNRDETLVTRAQAIVLDMHFVIEQIARSTAGLPMAFNGSGGMWRRSCIDDAGGWQADTLTEDLDLSFRAVLRGWRGCYLPGESAAGELPRDVSAYKLQQARWARGSLQTVRKLIGALLHSSLALHGKIAGALHLTGYFVHPLIFVTSLTTPLLLLQPAALSGPAGTVGLLSVAPLLAMFVSSTARGRAPWQFARDLLPALLLGVGVAFSNSVAMTRALRTRETGEFARTPKGASGDGSSPRARPDLTTWGELALALYAICAMLLLVHAGAPHLAAPLLLYAGGYGGVWAAQMRDSTNIAKRTNSKD